MSNLDLATLPPAELAGGDAAPVGPAILAAGAPRPDFASLLTELPAAVLAGSPGPEPAADRPAPRVEGEGRELLRLDTASVLSAQGLLLCTGALPLPLAPPVLRPTEMGPSPALPGSGRTEAAAALSSPVSVAAAQGLLFSAGLTPLPLAPTLSGPALPPPVTGQPWSLPAAAGTVETRKSEAPPAEDPLISFRLPPAETVAVSPQNLSPAPAPVSLPPETAVMAEPPPGKLRAAGFAGEEKPTAPGRPGREVLPRQNTIFTQAPVLAQHTGTAGAKGLPSMHATAFTADSPNSSELVKAAGPARSQEFAAASKNPTVPGELGMPSSGLPPASAVSLLPAETSGASLSAALLPALQEYAQATVESPRGRMELEVKLEGMGPVRVQLEWQGGALRLLFKSASPELQQALQQAWPTFQREAGAHGWPVAAAQFQSLPGAGDFLSDHSPREERAPEPAPEPGASPSARQGSRAPSPHAASPPSRSLSLWA